MFRTDVIAALSRVGCNSGTCHGSPQGKNGFRLSLRGFDADLDYSTLVREQGGRRLNPVDPEQSLLLLKATGRVAHQGGALMGRDHPSYQVLLSWIEQGCRDVVTPQLVRLEMTPGSHRLPPGTQSLTLTARAHFADGSSRAVSPLTVFTSSDPDLAPVSASGVVRFQSTGEASILARYLDQVVSVRLTYVQPDTSYHFQGPRIANFIDEHVFAKQRELQLLPAPIATDAVFLRRVYLDTIGVLPAAEEAKAFLDSTDANKRALLIDRLLQREEYARFWALKWADILRGSPTTISERGVHSFHRYLVRTFAEDRPMTEFARELLTGTGNTIHHPRANFYRISRTPEDAVEAAAQVFMGLRMSCAKCHNHPFEAITQTDYYGMAAFFAQVQMKGNQFGLDDEVVTLQARREIQHPRTRKNQEPLAFGLRLPGMSPDDDRRVFFADWLTAPENKYFAPSMVNRVWYHLLGTGIVDPVDDFRDTNPPSNPALLDALAADFTRNGSRLRPLIRTILNSSTYQLASRDEPTQSPHAAKGDRYFTRAGVRMLAAEQILDAVSSATGVPEKFDGYPLGTRALDLPEGGIQHPLLQAFAKPVRDVNCECAREDDPSLPQVLHLLNNAGLLAKVKSPQGRIAGWVKQNRDPRYLIEQIYLATLTRRPTDAERDLILKHLASQPDMMTGLSDLQHALINVNEFLLRH